VLQDGVPVSYAPYGQPQLSLAPVALGNLDSIDVVRGAGSVRYGPQNVGGIINFTTRAIPKTFAAEASIGTEIYSHGGNVKTTPSFFVGGTNESGLGLAVLYSGTHGKGAAATTRPTSTICWSRAATSSATTAFPLRCTTSRARARCPAA
jgi:Fe(3+) dicitrate transport protein